jgi:hypothetical protein
MIDIDVKNHMNGSFFLFSETLTILYVRNSNVTEQKFCEGFIFLIFERVIVLYANVAATARKMAFVTCHKVKSSFSFT